MTDYRDPTTPDGELDPEAERIVSEIEETRSEMGATINQIGHRLQPDTIVNEAREKIREATVGRVERIVDDAGQTAQRTGNTLIETIRANPVPAALAALGIGWLAMRLRDQQSEMSWRHGMNGYGHRPQYSDGYTGRYRPQGSGPAPVEQVKRLADDAASRVQEVGSDVQRAAGSAADEAQRKLGEAQWQARTALQDTQWQAERTFNENPLALGALAVGVGAAIGLALPSTQKERELMGEQRDKLMGQATQVAGQVLDEAKIKAEEVGQQVQQQSNA